MSALRRAVLQILGEERRQDVAPELQRGVGVEADRAERAAVMDLLPVIPRAQHQEDLVVGRVLRLDRLVDRGRAVHVLLVPEAGDQHHRHGQRLRGQHLVHRLLLPEGVVGGMLQQLAPEAELLHAVPAAQLAGGAGRQVLVVVVVVGRPPLRRGIPRRLLVVDVGEVLLPEGAVVEPVVAAPAVHHRVHRDRHLERRVRVDERHQRQEPVVRDAEDPDLAVGLRDVLHQPVDGVVGVGGVIDGVGLSGPRSGRFIT